MEQPDYAMSVFEKHYARLDPQGKRKGFVMLELGPGDSLSSAPIAYVHGAKACYLVDAGSFAADDFETYAALIGRLHKKGFDTSELSRCTSLADLLDACSCTYLTSGIQSLRTLPDKEMDFIWSHTVLQLVRKQEFMDFVRELRRIIRPDGVCSHRIDLKDLLAESLNNLRFPQTIWETGLIASSGFYTNRIRYSQMLDIFQQAGFSCEVLHVDRWDTLPIPREKLAREFRGLSDDDLMISGFDVVLRPA
jgi:SAM-dependent methyltransferase